MVAVGAMRLSTERDRDDDRSVAVLHAAFDAGITLDRLTSPNPAWRAETEPHRREVQTETLEAVDKIQPEVTEQYVDTGIHTDGQDRYVG